jgi:hypothetical protein
MYYVLVGLFSCLSGKAVAEEEEAATPFAPDAPFMLGFKCCFGGCLSGDRCRLCLKRDTLAQGGVIYEEGVLHGVHLEKNI